LRRDQLTFHVNVAVEGWGCLRARAEGELRRPHEKSCPSWLPSRVLFLTQPLLEPTGSSCSSHARELALW